jgi:hypothetical protein
VSAPAEHAGRRATAGAVVLGAGAPLAAFAPLSDVSESAGDHLWVALVSPPVLLAALALWLARSGRRGDAARLPRTLPVGAALVALGCVLSFLETDTFTASAALALLAVGAPILLFAAIRRAGLPTAPLVWAFLGTCALLLFHADLVFFRDHGLGIPSTAELVAAKFAGSQGFHHHLLGDAERSATFTLMPFTTAAWMASADAVSRSARGWALAVALICGLTLLLLFAATPLVIAAAVTVACLARSPLPRAARLGLLAATIPVALWAFETPSARDYLNRVNDTPAGHGPRPLSAGFDRLLDHPLTGIGLGRFGFRDGGAATHSVLAQAAADIGAVGLVGAVLVIGSIVALLPHALRRPSLAAQGAGLGAGTYAAAILVAGGATLGVAAGLSAVWALTPALLLAAATAPSEARAWVPEFLRELDRRRRAEPERRGMLAYGIVLGVALAAYLSATLPAHVELIPTRVEELSAVFAAHAQDKGPLVGFVPGKGFFPAGMEDNPGLAWALPGLGDLFGWHTYASAFRGFYIGILSCSIAIVPALAARLFRSRLAGLVVPLAAIWSFRFVDVGDSYFLPAIAGGLGLPALLLIDRRWERSRPVPPATFVALMLFASLAAMFRSGAGTPLIVVGIVVLWRHTTWRHRLPALLVTLLAYAAVSHGGIRLIEAQRAHVMGHTRIADEQAERLGGDHFDDPGLAGRNIPWHLVYIGLGFDGNRYRIAYLDENAIDYALSVDPKAVFGTSRYNDVLRDRYLEILRTDPGFMARTTARKALVLVDDGLRRFPLVLAVLGGVLLLARRRSRERRWVGLLLLAALVAVTYPLAVMPLSRYEVGWFTALAWIWLLGLGWACAALASARRPALTPARRRVAWTALAALLVLGGLRVGARSAHAALHAATRTAPSAPFADSTAGPAVARWPLWSGLPASWSRRAGVLEPSGTSLSVATSSERFAYQLLGPALRLPPATYIATARGAIGAGGLQVGVLDVAKGTWLGTAAFTAQRTSGRRVSFPVQFALAVPTRVQLILSNYSEQARSSRWSLVDASIRGAAPADTLAIDRALRRRPSSP